MGWDALHDLMNRAADAEDVQAIRAMLIATWGVPDVHDLRTRKAGDLILVDVHPDIDVDFTVGQGHDIAVDARARAMKHVAPRQRERVVEVTSGIRGR
ncbi:cation transporter dimerization domain-containing protein [Burkholderia multivorans]|nr:Ferrous-iron efflux pump FieF [Burkholderia multivorans]MDR8826966.1 Ferrous-iron efflux pump FieF [Burkholderia multivorans]MDR8872627.1 Ferrous-iron efflux pump FieF [Burkholderia multivorans]MDR8878630.1 Ferrous-iron efflux pump FieF [Burkholderia multivorans]MDR8885529.1 Ferrous-iron efflux pump FieF [Burkholderia multivorans]